MSDGTDSASIVTVGNQAESANFERNSLLDFLGDEVVLDGVVDANALVDESESSPVVSHFKLNHFKQSTNTHGTTHRKIPI